MDPQGGKPVAERETSVTDSIIKYLANIHYCEEDNVIMSNNNTNLYERDLQILFCISEMCCTKHVNFFKIKYK